MRYHLLAADYDGTLATEGVISELTFAALRRLRETRRKLVMVTGRELDELLALLPHPELFDRIVAENGAVLYDPATKDVRVLCAPAALELVSELKRRGVERVAVGRAIVACWEPDQEAVLAAIHDLGLELQVIFNKGAVMVLPSGINKAFGLAAALAELGLSPHNCIAIGDAENDHALLASCECGVAVANALPSLKDRADLVMPSTRGDGVIELVDQLVTDDLASLAVLRRHIRLDDAHSLDPYAGNMLVCGTSGSGKSTLTTGLLEHLSEAGYQFAIIDPEGDYTGLPLGVALGSPARAPLLTEILDVLRDPAHSVIVNMLGISLEHRPEWYAEVAPALADLGARTGRPHWLVVDEAHHLLPVTAEPVERTPRPRGTIYITVHPGLVAPDILDTIETLFVLGERPHERVAELCKLAGLRTPVVEPIDKLAPHTALYWKVGSGNAVVIQLDAPKSERTRHSRKYIEGNLGPAHSFYFKGRDNKLNLKAYNLLQFAQLAAGVDDDTWTFHLTSNHYSEWFRVDIKDEGLADEVLCVERDAALSPEASRAAIFTAITNRYTLPADKPSGVVDDSQLKA